MRASQTAWILWGLSLPFIVCSQPGGVEELDKDLLPQLRRRSSTESTTPSSLSTITLSVQGVSATAKASSTQSTSTSATDALPTVSTVVDLIPTSSDSSAAASTPVSAASSKSSTMTIQHRNLIIILSSVLGSVGLILVAVSVYLLCRYRKGKAPFRGQGGATPIDDNEIDSWRNTLEQKRPIVAAGAAIPHTSHTPRGPSIDSIALKHSPNWTWTPPPTGKNVDRSPGAMIPSTPDFIARAPNSRVGLTDAAIPGAAPYIPPPKRQSSRLSKKPPGHIRTQSRKSSMSQKSVWSYNGGPINEVAPIESMPTWYDPDSESVGTALRGDGTDSPGVSMFDELSSAGGLSPRPKSKILPWNKDYMWDKETDIGRAIA